MVGRFSICLGSWSCLFPGNRLRMAANERRRRCGGRGRPIVGAARPVGDP